MILSHEELVEIVAQGVITEVPLDYIGGTSVDVSLANHILVEGRRRSRYAVTPSNPQAFVRRALPYSLKPGEFALASTRQKFNLPLDISAEFKSRSTMARLGLEHLNACWFDPGWRDSHATLEFKNMNTYHSILLERGMRVGQVIFFRHKPIPLSVSYGVRGKYNAMQFAEPARAEKENNHDNA